MGGGGLANHERRRSGKPGSSSLATAISPIGVTVSACRLLAGDDEQPGWQPIRGVGGVLAIDPWFAPQRSTERMVQVVQVDEPGLKAFRMLRSSRRSDVSVLDAHYLVGGEAGIEHFIERHELGLFPLTTYVAAVEGTGLCASIDSEGLTGRGLILGTWT
jgi:hypothetical protein